jgi:anaerobic carbon-monoxide dehydrogenase catalytic subunit
VAASIGIETEGKSIDEIAKELYVELEKTYTQVEGEIPFAKRVPPKTLETWRKLGIVPRGAMREIMEMMHRTHMGVDQDYKNITTQCSRTALSDGWGGSMVATEISDILFGTPVPVATEVNMGVLKENEVNIIVHGHEPNLFESMIASVQLPHPDRGGQGAGAGGINLVGMCCSGLEMISRRGFPMRAISLRPKPYWLPVRWMHLPSMCSASSRGSSKWQSAMTPICSPQTRGARSKGADHLEFHEDKPLTPPMKSSSRPYPASRGETPGPDPEDQKHEYSRIFL